MANDDCGCGKPKPGPLGGKPQPGSLIASAGGQSGRVTYVSPTGAREEMTDALAARAEIVRRGGGSIEFG